MFALFVRQIGRRRLAAQLEVGIGEDDFEKVDVSIGQLLPGGFLLVLALLALLVKENTVGERQADHGDDVGEEFPGFEGHGVPSSQRRLFVISASGIRRRRRRHDW